MKIFLDGSSDFEITTAGYSQLIQILKARYCRLEHMAEKGETKELREKMILLHVQINELEAVLERN